MSAPRISGSPVSVPRSAPAARPTPPPKTSAPQQTGYSNVSSFESNSSAAPLTGWKANDKYVKQGYEDLAQIDSPEAKPALEILSTGGTATHAEIEELRSAQEGTGLLGKLASQLPEGTTSDGKTYNGKAADEAVAMLNVVKGFMTWIANTMFLGK